MCLESMEELTDINTNDPPLIDFLKNLASELAAFRGEKCLTEEDFTQCIRAACAGGHQAGGGTIWIPLRTSSALLPGAVVKYGRDGKTLRPFPGLAKTTNSDQSRRGVSVQRVKGASHSSVE